MVSKKKQPTLNSCSSKDKCESGEHMAQIVKNSIKFFLFLEGMCLLMCLLICLEGIWGDLLCIYRVNILMA